MTCYPHDIENKLSRRPICYQVKNSETERRAPEIFLFPLFNQTRVCRSAIRTLASHIDDPGQIPRPGSAGVEFVCYSVDRNGQKTGVLSAYTCIHMQTQKNLDDQAKVLGSGDMQIPSTQKRAKDRSIGPEGCSHIKTTVVRIYTQNKVNHKQTMLTDLTLNYTKKQQQSDRFKIKRI